jgi:SAM-dependent methyltransferase
MFRESAAVYDIVYSSLKDYAAETAEIARLLRQLHPDCRTILDAACGTGEHARWLATHGFEVDGFDLDPAFVRIAQQKLPERRFVEADMADFHLGRRYDAVVCLFSSIGYLKTLDRVTQALVCFREHLEPDGVILAEPWFPPGGLDPDRVAENRGEADGVCVTRTSRVRIDDRISRLFFDYEITDAAGTRHASEVHELGLFTPAEMLRAFEQAELEARYDPQGPAGRGLYVGRR